MMTNKKYQKCKERRKYYLAAFLFVLISLLLAELDIFSFVITKYKDTRDWANRSEDVQFFSSAFTLFIFSLIYVFSFYTIKIKKLKKQIRFISDEMGFELLNEKKKGYIALEKELRNSLREKNIKLIERRTNGEDCHLLLSQIKGLQKEIQDIQDKLDTLENLI